MEIADVSCASCHSPLTSSGDAQSLAVGTGAVSLAGLRQPGAGRQFAPRNAPSLFNSALGSFYMFWDGRLAQDLGPGRFHTPTGVTLPAGLSGLLAAQAMMPVTNRVEMRGTLGDLDVTGQPNELARWPDTDNGPIWNAVMSRVLAIPAYLQKFNTAFPSLASSELGFQHAANAIAAFEAQTFTKTNTAVRPISRARRQRAVARRQARGAAVLRSGALLVVSQRPVAGRTVVRQRRGSTARSWHRERRLARLGTGRDARRRPAVRGRVFVFAWRRFGTWS